jgi:hypothetical protein
MDDTKQKQQAKSAARVVSHGVDTLLLNAYYLNDEGQPTQQVLDTAMVGQLEEWKRMAQVASEPVVTSWSFQGVSLHIRPNGAGRGHWQWLLISRLLTVCVSRGKWSGGIAQVRLSSEYLWSAPSLETAMRQVHDFLREFFGCDLFLQVSEVHLCADVAGWADIAHLDYQQVFVSRSRKRADHLEADWNIETGNEFKVESFTYGLTRTGLAFSAHGSLSCSIYDKTRELKRSGKTWFEDLWHYNGWEQGETVWRVEFRFKRDALHELQQAGIFHGIENAYDLPGRLAVLWAYAAGQVSGGVDGLPDGWLRCTVPNTDRNRSRWPTHPVWTLVQGAFRMSCVIPDSFGAIVRKRHEERNILKGLEATLGYATSLSSWVGGDLASEGVDLSVFLHWLAMNGIDFLEEKGTSFEAEVQRKRLKFGLTVAQVQE